MVKIYIFDKSNTVTRVDIFKVFFILLNVALLTKHQCVTDRRTDRFALAITAL